jgi:hypothetical protein
MRFSKLPWPAVIGLGIAIAAASWMLLSIFFGIVG